MKKIILLFSFLIIIFLTSCTTYKTASGDVITKTFSNNEASTLIIDSSLNIVSKSKVKSFATINFIEASERKVEVSTNESFFQVLQVSTASDRISLKSTNQNTFKLDSFTVNIYGYNISSISAHNFTINGKITSSDLVISAEDHAKFDLDLSSVTNLSATLSNHSDLTSDELLNLNTLKLYLDENSYVNFDNKSSILSDITIEANDSTKVVLKGSASKVVASATEASNLRLIDLSVSDADITLSGASTCKIYVIDVLKYNIKSSSTLEYKGNPLISEESYKSTASFLNKLEE